MNKKKNFVDILFALLLLAGVASCSNDQPLDPTDHTRAISFGNVSTRVVSSADDILEFGVFTQQNLGPDGTDESLQWLPLLEGERVYREDASKEFTYDNTRYWVADRVFHFFAVWPYAGAADSPVTNVSWADGDGAYGYAVTFVTPETADEELLTAKTTVETTTELEFPESVGLNFEHQLTNVNLKIWSNGAPDNVQDKIRVKEVSISNVTKKGTLNTTPQSGSSWKYSSEKMSFTTTYDGDGITNVSQAQIINNVLVPNDVSDLNPSDNSPCVPFESGLLLIPHTITQSNPVVVTVKYYLQRPIDQEENLWEEKKLQVLLPEGTWPAGKKLTYNLIISGERTITEFQINSIVEDWKPQTEMIDFTEQIEVRDTEKMHWVEGTYENINEEKGEVVLFTDVEKIAVCEFNIRTPIGATWTASLIPLTASAMDAFSIVEDSKYGEVGTDVMQRVKIKINNPDPISARNACLLRITVQTSDGRTIVVKNLMPKAAASNKIEEFTIIQNLING